MSGGYPYEPVGVVQDDLYCVVCLNLMKDAMQLDNCDHGMCNICLQSIMKALEQSNTDPSCPICRQTININKVHPAKMVNKMIKCTKVKCLHADAGCKWQGDLLDAKPHMDSKCLYQEITCLYAQNGCNVNVLRGVLEDHVQECEFRQIRCDYCNEEFVYNYIPIHMQVCDYVPVLCSNGCNMEVIRKNTNEHLKSCPKVSVECPFKNVGCSQKMLRSGLHVHEVSSVTSHLLCTKEKLEIEVYATVEKHQETKMKLSDVEEEHHETKKKLADVEVELEETKKRVGDVESEHQGTKKKLSVVEEEYQGTKKKLGDVEEELKKAKEMLGDVESEHKDTKKKLGNVEKKLEEACDHLKKLSFKSEVDIQYETMILENYKTFLSMYMEKYKTKLSNNMVAFLSNLLESSDAVNDAFADLVVKKLQDFAKKFINSVPSVEDYSKQIESTFSLEFGKIWLLRLKQNFVTKAELQFSLFKSALLLECEKYHNNRANSILMICMEKRVCKRLEKGKLCEYIYVDLNGKECDPRWIELQYMGETGLGRPFLISLSDDIHVNPYFQPGAGMLKFPIPADDQQYVRNGYALVGIAEPDRNLKIRHDPRFDPFF